MLVIFHLAIRRILHFLLYTRTSICSLSNYLQNINAFSRFFFKLIAQKEITLPFLAEFYLLDLVRMLTVNKVLFPYLPRDQNPRL